MSDPIYLQNGRQWDASCVFDSTQGESQDALNAVTGALDALKVAGNNGKVLGIVNGAFGAIDIPKTEKKTVSLSATWTGSGPYTQTVTVTGYTITANSKVDLQPDSTAIAQLVSDGVQALYIVNNNGTLTAYAVGAPTTAALTLQCTITEVAA